jgi:hypothetical protein
MKIKNLRLEVFLGKQIAFQEGNTKHLFTQIVSTMHLVFFFTLFVFWMNCFHSTYRSLNWDPWRLHSKYLVSIWTFVICYKLFRTKMNLFLLTLFFIITLFKTSQHARSKLCPEHYEAQAKADVELCCRTLPCPTTQLALTYPNVRITENCAAMPCVGCVACFSITASAHTQWHASTCTHTHTHG